MLIRNKVYTVYIYNKQEHPEKFLEMTSYNIVAVTDLYQASHWMYT